MLEEHNSLRISTPFISKVFVFTCERLANYLWRIFGESLAEALAKDAFYLNLGDLDCGLVFQ